MAVSRTKADGFMLRLPEGMRDRIKEAAEENGRSMNAEIVQRLERSFERPAGSASSIDGILEDVSALRETILKAYFKGMSEAMFDRFSAFEKSDPKRLQFMKDMRLVSQIFEAEGGMPKEKEGGAEEKD